jgi:hypothetical protein
VRRYAIVGVVLMALLAVSHLYAYRTGKNVVRGEMAKAVADYQLAEHELLTKLAEARRDRQIVYRDRIKLIRTAGDDGCLDRTLPAAADGLRKEISGGAAQPGVDP